MIDLETWRTIVTIAVVLVGIGLAVLIMYLRRYFVPIEVYMKANEAQEKAAKEARVEAETILALRFKSITEVLDPMRKETTETCTGIEKVEGRMSAIEQQTITVARDFGRLEKQLERLEEVSLLNKTEIIAFFQERAESIRKDLHMLETLVARLDERLIKP